MAGPSDALLALGFSEHFAAELAALGRPELVPARVVRASRRFCTVWDGHSEISATTPKKITPPVVGDWIALEPDTARTAALLARRSAFLRRAAGRSGGAQVIAANVDCAFLMSGLDGDFNPRRIERYLALTLQSGARPVVLLNKADLVADAGAPAESARAVAAGAPVHVVSAKHGLGLDALGVYLTPGATVAILGSSGVGKSTLANRLVGEERMRTAEVRERDDRGRHTTIHGELLVLPGGALLIDTPGLRELGLVAAAEGIAEAFGDVEALVAACRFSDCSHRSEPGCAVQAAIASGDLDPSRLDSYRKLRAESERPRRGR